MADAPAASAAFSAARLAGLPERPFLAFGGAEARPLLFLPPPIPGIPGIPLQNYLGWLLASIVLMFLLDRLPRKVAADGVPTVLLTWVFASNIVANLVFFHRPGVALWGGVCMGLVIVPWLWRLWSQPQW